MILKNHTHVKLMGTKVLGRMVQKRGHLESSYFFQLTTFLSKKLMTKNDAIQLVPNFLHYKPIYQNGLPQLLSDRSSISDQNCFMYPY